MIPNSTDHLQSICVESSVRWCEHVCQCCMITVKNVSPTLIKALINRLWLDLHTLIRNEIHNLQSNISEHLILIYLLFFPTALYLFYKKLRMGIQGLLPFLKEASEPIHIRKYKGYTVGIDSYCWIHRGAVACATQLAKGEPADQ